LKISIIIPALNEVQHIGPLVGLLKRDPSFPLVREIIVVDGNSEDGTASEARRAGALVVHSPQRGRASQMNLGAAQAQGEILYFLHADTVPPCEFAQQIWEAHARGYKTGCFRLKFDWSHWFLSFNSWFTRFNLNLLRFGDQSLFIERRIFDASGGFNSNMKIFEDQDIIDRACKKKQFVVLPNQVITSARKYRQNGPFRLQLAYFILYLFYKFGLSQQNLVRLYLKMVPFPRV